MLPPGHIAGAYLVTTAALAILHPNISPEQGQALLWIGIFFGIAPDFDFFYGFIKNKTVTAAHEEFDHRNYLSHAPILWLLGGLLIFFIAPGPFWKMIGLLAWIGSWTHFVLDSIECGIMWLWPFRNKRYSVTGRVPQFDFHEKRFFPFWMKFMFWYARNTVTFWFEALLCVIAIGYWLMGR